jgi:TRAP-type mannitol/chloroaromatic compound transport system permease small subunit
VGLFLLSAQGISELIKRLAFLQGLIPDPVEKHKDPGLDLVLEVEREGKK